MNKLIFKHFSGRRHKQFKTFFEYATEQGKQDIITKFIQDREVIIKRLKPNADVSR